MRQCRSVPVLYAKAGRSHLRGGDRVPGTVQSGFELRLVGQEIGYCSFEVDEIEYPRGVVGDEDAIVAFVDVVHEMHSVGDELLEFRIVHFEYRVELDVKLVVVLLEEFAELRA